MGFLEWHRPGGVEEAGGGVCSSHASMTGTSTVLAPTDIASKLMEPVSPETPVLVKVSATFFDSSAWNVSGEKIQSGRRSQGAQPGVSTDASWIGPENVG